jgi:hypothetical protein
VLRKSKNSTLKTCSFRNLTKIDRYCIKCLGIVYIVRFEVLTAVKMMLENDQIMQCIAYNSVSQPFFYKVPLCNFL